MNDLARYRDALAGVTPWAGEVDAGFLVDFLGTRTDVAFRMLFEGRHQPTHRRHATTALPTIGDGGNAEGWFEAVNWFAAAREARERYVMITLGACYGGPAVGAWRALQMVNPMPSRLVLVEPEPDNFRWIERHLRNNGIDPAHHWLLQMAVSDRIDPVFFPVGAPGSGAQNCYATNEMPARRDYARQLSAAGRAEQALHDLLLTNSTGITKDLVPGEGLTAEIKLASAITLRELLGPFDRVDYLDSDIQQSEILVFPPFIDLLRRKVRRIHIGTHGADVHRELHDLFAARGWEIVFSYPPNAVHDSALGRFATNDGVLTVCNPDLDRRSPRPAAATRHDQVPSTAAGPSEDKTREPQYQELLRTRDTRGTTRFGLMANDTWNRDPRRLLFTLARYKFVARMLAGRRHVLEIGCGDAFGTRIVQQSVGKVTATDFDPVFIDDIRQRHDPDWPLDAFVHDILAAPVPGRYDAAFALDVLEHIPEAREDRLLGNLLASLAPDGVAIIGMPSLESQVHASAQSKAGHVNCKTGPALQAALERHFHTVLIFSMNDEVVHTGFTPMAHYLLAVASHRRSGAAGDMAHQ